MPPYPRDPPIAGDGGSQVQRLRRALGVKVTPGKEIMRAISNTRGTVNEPTYNFLTVTIGRNYNIATTPFELPAELSPYDWEQFQIAVTEAVDHYLPTRYAHEIHYGAGEWEGATEESAVLSFRYDTPSREFTSGAVQNVSRLLASVARDYGQDAIAVAYGRTALVERAPELFTVVAETTVEA